MNARTTTAAAPATAPIVIRAERALARVPHSAQLEALEHVLSEVLGSEGVVRRDQNTLIWESRKRRVVISYVRTEQGTVVRVDESLQRMASLTFGGIMGGLGGALSGAMVGVGLGIDLGGTPLVPLALGVVIMAGTFLLARLLFFREARKRYAQLNQLAEALTVHNNAP
jgi:hypothetical protein